MKRLSSILIALVATLAATAATWSVGDIPNVHLTDSAQYVSDPDGILTPEAKSSINAAMRNIRRSTSAEAVVVIVDNIDSDDIDTFATELFTEWGLGKKDVDNGLLILVAKDMRRAAIRPGYGLEGVLPDIICASILRDRMFPEFRKGDYSAGLVAASETVETLLTDPDAAAEIRSKLDDADFASHDSGEDNFFAIFFTISGIVTFAMLILLLAMLWKLRGKNHRDRYLALVKLKPAYLALSFLGLGVPVAASLPLLIVLWHLRNSRHKCPRCGTAMKKIDEVHDNEYLTNAQDLEERIGSVDYDVWLCPSCGETDIEQYITPSSGYKECPHCHAHASRLTRSRILRQPTTATQGQGVKDYTCLNCGFVNSLPFTLPVIVAAPIITGGGGHRGGGGFGGGSFGGGFGGGMTGGGGASGGW